MLRLHLPAIEVSGGSTERFELSPAAERSIAKLLSALQTLIPSAGGPLFDAWCIADTDLAMMVERLLKTGYDLPESIRRYAEAQWNRPSVREFADQKRPPHRPALV